MKSKSILIVEDEILIAEGIRIYLEEVGYKVAEIAVSYDQAVEFIGNLPIDLVLLDIRLYGKKSGIDLANYLKKDTINLPFVYLTSQYDKRILEYALDTNPLGYLVKPIQKHSLFTTIETAFNRINNIKIVQIKSGKTTHHVKIDEVMYVKSDHVYCEIHMVKKTIILTRCTLMQLIILFNSEKIFKCHRSYAINSTFINNCDGNNFIMCDKSIIPISRSYKSESKQLFLKVKHP